MHCSQASERREGTIENLKSSSPSTWRLAMLPRMSSPVRPPDPSTVEVLPRVLGPFDAVMIVVGSIIGSGIFLKVSNIDAKVPSFGAIMAVWLLGGAATLSGSLSLAELAAMLPHAGGPYVYLREAYGRVTAFLCGWGE